MCCTFGQKVLLYNKQKKKSENFTFGSNVFIRLEKFICLINEDNGGNDLVEPKRGIKYSDMKFDFDLNLRKIMNNNMNETIRLAVTDKCNVISEENIGDDDNVIGFEANI